MPMMVALLWLYRMFTEGGCCKIRFVACLVFFSTHFLVYSPLLMSLYEKIHSFLRKCRRLFWLLYVRPSLEQSASICTWKKRTSFGSFRVFFLRGQSERNVMRHANCLSFASFCMPHVISTSRDCPLRRTRKISLVSLFHCTYHADGPNDYRTQNY